MTTVVFGFGGTIALGSGPVVAFANALSEQTAGPDVVSASLLALEEFESGKSEDRDGYAAVTGTAAREMAAFRPREIYLVTDIERQRSY